jgi:hypothetical protein
VNFWFVENLVYLLLGLLLVLALPIVDRWERRLSFALPVLVLAGGLLVRFEVFAVSPFDHLSTPARLFWLFALGWAAGKARTHWHRLLVTAAGVGAVVGYFGNPLREGVIIAGLLLLVWVPHLPSTATVNRVAGALAGSSLHIYLIHWQVYPLLKPHSPALALVASLGAGVLFGVLVERVATRLAQLRRRKPASTAAGPSARRRRPLSRRGSTSGQRRHRPVSARRARRLGLGTEMRLQDRAGPAVVSR